MPPERGAVPHTQRSDVFSEGVAQGDWLLPYVWRPHAKDMEVSWRRQSPRVVHTLMIIDDANGNVFSHKLNIANHNIKYIEIS